MTGNDFLSIDQTTAVLDNAPVAVFVSSIDGRKLLYTNRLARNLFPEAGGSNAACYNVAGFSEPCPFCRIDEMSVSEFKTREYKHPGNGRIFQISGKLIDWAGAPAHIEYIMDITTRKLEEEQLRKSGDELRSTFERIPCGLCVYQLKEGKIRPVFHNQIFYDITGYSEEHIQSVEQETTYLGVHPEDVVPLREKIDGLIKSGGVLRHTYRLWNDKKGEYQWIRLEGTVVTDETGCKLLYGVYSDVSEQKRLERKLTEANEKMQDIINAIPGGVAIYRVSDIFETVYFSDGVAALSGYTVEEYAELIKRDAAELIYPEDATMVVEKIRNAIKNHTVAEFEFRKLHRDGHIVWVHIQAKQIGEDGGCPLLHCVFHNISALRETQMEMDHLVNSIPGGIASFKVEGGKIVPVYYSDGIPTLTGHTREEFEENIRRGITDYIYEPDRKRILGEGHLALENGGVLDVSYRVRRKDGSLSWVHLNGCRMGPMSESMRFYAVCTGMSAESRLYQNIANETADGIYVIDKENYELLYANEAKCLFTDGRPCTGQKCYSALQGKTAPCEFCTLKAYGPDGQEHEFAIEENGRFYTARGKETEWNGIPAYIQYVRDVTEEVNTRREKERLEMYFQNIVEALPGGVSVNRVEPDGGTKLEYISSGVAAMTHMEIEEVKALYANDICAGIHKDDVQEIRKKLAEFIKSGQGHCELPGRMLMGDGGYIWVKNTLSLLHSADGVLRLYSVYTDISSTVKETEQFRRQYEELLLQHYHTPGPNELILGHCNITQNRILEIWDATDSGLLEAFGTVREDFFSGLAGFIIDDIERREFLDTFLSAPALVAFAKRETEKVQKCFVKFPREESGRYVQINMNMVETPGTGDVTGILTVTDITDQTISDSILHKMSLTTHDYIVDLDLTNDSFKLLSHNINAHCAPESHGCHSQRVAFMAKYVVVPKDRERYSKALDAKEIYSRLKNEDAYTVAYSVKDEKGEIRTKNMTVFSIDMRLGRVCLVCTDITDSVREQQGMLNMIAYTFDLAGFIHIPSGQFTMYTRQMVLENLLPFRLENYDSAMERFVSYYSGEENSEEVRRQFQLNTMIKRLEEKPSGYDFVFPYRSVEGSLQYKQVNVLWGDQNHETVCVVRADVTDTLAAERASKKALEDALALAREASQAKSDFLTSMSHDIRTPMNAIMGMTTLALAHLDDAERVKNCLQKISVSNKHLLSLINDVLDMSRIEHSKIVLNQRELSLSDLVGQLSAIMGPQAKDAGLQLVFREEGIEHENFYGDSLRISQILINLLSNAVKFTPEGGRVDFLTEETIPVEYGKNVRYRFTISDTGIGMSEDFLSHIFDPFSREKSVTRIEGTGLGLSITKGLVDLMGGSITVQSHLGKGSAFLVELEFERAEKGEPINSGGRTSNKDKDLSGLNFLIAEDHPINAELLGELLAMCGARSVVRQDGSLAVKAFQDSPPGTYDAILMDIQMPVMTGYEATRTIRELDRPDAKTIPIIAMTANAFAEDIQTSLESGMNAHVAKPIDLDVLCDTLYKLLK